MKAVLIADRVTSLGFRLAGVQVLLPTDPQELAKQFSAALRDNDLVLITGSLAAQLPYGEVLAAIRSASPAVQVLPVATQASADQQVRNLVLRSLGVAA